MMKGQGEHSAAAAFLRQASCDLSRTSSSMSSAGSLPPTPR